MPKFKVRVWWTVEDTMEIEAKDAQAAHLKAMAAPLPAEGGDYVGDSFAVGEITEIPLQTFSYNTIDNRYALVDLNTVSDRQKQDYVKRNANVLAGRPLCPQCDGTGNAFLYKHLNCPSCLGTGCLIEKKTELTEEQKIAFRKQFWKDAR